MKNKYLPEIRFSGFTGDWEHRKLGELADFSKGNGYSKSDLVDKGHPIILYGRLYTKYETVIESVDTFAIETEKSVISKGNEVIVPASGETSKDISRASAVSKPGIILGGDLNIVRPSNEIEPVFLALAISNGEQQKELSKRAQGKSVVHLHNSDLKEANLLFPKKEEQTKIGDFFKQLDDMITLHQQELTILKQTKQGFLQKMFPKEGESVPEVRFPGFNEEWKQRKLGEMSKSFEYGLNASATEYDGKNKYIRITDIDDNTHEFLEDNLTSPNIDLSSAENYLVKEGDILFARTGASVGKSYIYDKKDGKVYYAGFLIRARIKSGYDPEFIFQNTLTSKYNEFIKITSQRSGQPGVNAQEYANFSIMTPNIEEQALIGNFFRKLDDTIALHQQELDALKETKKAFLQKMFV